MDSECVNCDDLARERSAEARKWLGHFQQAAAENEELRARLAEVEAERDATRALLDDVTADAGKLAGEVVRYRDLWEKQTERLDNTANKSMDTAEELRARLAAVLALCDDRRSGLYVGQEGWIEIAAVRAAAAGADQ